MTRSGLGLLMVLACGLLQAWVWRPGAAWRVADRIGLDRSELKVARCRWDGGPIAALGGLELSHEGFSIAAPSMRIELARLPLLIGRLRPLSVTLEEPEIEIDLAEISPTWSAGFRAGDTLSLALDDARLVLSWQDRAVADVGPWSGQGSLSRSGASLEKLRAPDLSLRRLVLEPDGVRLEGLALERGRQGWQGDAWLRGDEGALSWSGSLAEPPFSGRVRLARVPSGWVVDSLAITAQGGSWSARAQTHEEQTLRYRADLVARNQASLAKSMADLWRLLRATPMPFACRVVAAPCSLASGEVWGPLRAECVADGRGGSRGGVRGPGLELEWSRHGEGETEARCELDRVPIRGIGPVEGVVSGRLDAGAASDGGVVIEGELLLRDARVRSAPLHRAAQRAMPSSALRGLVFDRIDARTRLELPAADGAATRWSASLTLSSAELYFDGLIAVHDSLSGALSGVFRGESARELAEIPGLGPLLLDRKGELPGRIVVGGTWDDPTLSWSGSARADSLREAWTKERTQDLRRSLEEMLGIDEGGLDDPLERATLEGVLELYRRTGGRR